MSNQPQDESLVQQRRPLGHNRNRAGDAAPQRAHHTVGTILLAVSVCTAFLTDPADRPLWAQTADYDQLVKRLGSTAFRQREAAARQLEQAGLAARAALIRGLRSPDLEVRMEAHRVLVKLLKQDFDRRLASFLETGVVDQADRFPGWGRFRQTFGKDRKARQLYVELLRREFGVLRPLAEPAVDTALQIAVAQRLNDVMNARAPNGAREPVSVATIAALLFVTAQPELEADSIVESRIYSLLSQTTIKHAIQAGPRATMLKKLLSQWITHFSENRQSYYGLRLTLAFSLDQLGLTLARTTLEDSNRSASLYPYAAIAVARFGDRRDIPYLLPHLKDTTVCHTWSNRQIKKEPIRIQVRDIVLAMLIHMTGQDPQHYGYQLLAPDPDTIYRIYTFGFLEDKERDAALQKWNEWAASHQAALLPAPLKKTTASK